MNIAVSLFGLFVFGVGIVFGQIAEESSFRFFGSLLCAIGGVLFVGGIIMLN